MYQSFCYKNTSFLFDRISVDSLWNSVKFFLVINHMKHTGVIWSTQESNINKCQITNLALRTGDPSNYYAHLLF